jgi:hypothetical protein
MADLSEYQVSTIKDDPCLPAVARARWGINRMWELVECGYSVSQAKHSIGLSWKTIYLAERRGEMNEMALLAKEIRADVRADKFSSQREMEAIVCWYSSFGKEDEWALKRPYRAGQHLVGKRHNTPRNAKPSQPNH